MIWEDCHVFFSETEEKPLWSVTSHMPPMQNCGLCVFMLWRPCSWNESFIVNYYIYQSKKKNCLFRIWCRQNKQNCVNTREFCNNSHEGKRPPLAQCCVQSRSPESPFLFTCNAAKLAKQLIVVPIACNRSWKLVHMVLYKTSSSSG